MKTPGAGEKWRIGSNDETTVRSVAVVGAGIGGIKAALELAELGYQVKLMDVAPQIGGKLATLDRQFPTDDCGFCKILPTCREDSANATGTIRQSCLRRQLYHPNIELLPFTRVASLEGRPGDFRINYVKKARGVIEDRCIACGRCTKVCPAEAPGEIPELDEPRRAIGIQNPGGVPKTYTIDKDLCTKCGECVKVCPTAAIDLEMQDERNSLSVGAIVLSPGFQVIDPTYLAQYGFGRLPDVLTSVQFERLLSGLGPTKGELLRPSDGGTPKRIAFIQCVGCRDTERNYCSSACCMYTLKEARMALAKDPDLDISVFYMDIRTHGKDYFRYYESTRARGVKFIRSRPAEVVGKTDGRLEVVFSDEKEGIGTEDFDMVVLAVGQQPPEDSAELAQIFGIELDNFGFCLTQPFSMIKTSRNGVYVCGSFSRPKDIPDTVTEATALVSLINRQLGGPGVPKKAGPEGPEERAAEPEQAGPGPEGTIPAEEVPADDGPKIGVIFCNCHESVQDQLDLDDVSRFLEDLRPLSHPGGSPVYMIRTGGDCQQASVDRLRDRIMDSGINRLIICECAPFRSFERILEMFAALGRDTRMVELVDLGQDLDWTPGAKPTSKDEITRKLKTDLAMTLERLVSKRPLVDRPTEITMRALVFGWGIAGFTAALELALNGLPVDLVEESGELGGGPTDLFSTIEGYDVREVLGSTLKEVTNSDAIRVFTDTVPLSVEGQAGKYRVKFRTVYGKTDEKLPEEAEKEDVWTQEYGAIIIATGGRAHKPGSYHYGKDERIITQEELSDMLNKDRLDPKIKKFAFIQCVESREEERPYCSRICCIQALRNAIKLKEKDPECQIYILNRDICAYGKYEGYYMQAKDLGIRFIRYELDRTPKVDIKKKKLSVIVKDEVLGADLQIDPDLLVLGTGIDPNYNEVGDLLGLPRTPDGFFKEANSKFRPVDFLRPGVFLAGYAHSPKRREEMVVQAQAAASRVLSLLTKGTVSAVSPVSRVRERWCSGCLQCISACPFEARVFDPERKVVRVLDFLCQGCGICQMVCPNSAAVMEEMDQDQMFALIETGLEL